MANISNETGTLQPGDKVEQTIDSQILIDNLIEVIAGAEDEGSVTNGMVARVFNYLNTGFKNLLGKSSELTTEKSERQAADKVLQSAIDAVHSALRVVQERADSAKHDAATNKSTIDMLIGKNASDAIESFNEILAFLNGVKDDENLAGLLASLSERINGKQDALTVSPDLDLTDNRLAIKEAAKRAVFNDMWKKRGGTIDGDTYPLNGLTLTYVEALAIEHAFGVLWSEAATCPTDIRTMYTINQYQSAYGIVLDLTQKFQGCNNLEILSFSNCYPSALAWTFANCSKLREIKGFISMANVKNYRPSFGGCVALETVYIKDLNRNFDLADSPLLSLASFQYLIANAANGTTTITVTVHSDVYAKLTDTANAEWHKVLTDAANRNISLARA